jgi:hypothetical protein
VLGLYDIIFLSYHEENAEKHWELVRQRFPRAIHVGGITGLVKAHRTAAEQCKTRYFWVVDADNIVNDDFDFSFRWARWEENENRVAVWRARNNVNGLEYGYGGIKLLPRKAVLEVPDGVTDFTTSISDLFIPMEEVASTTVINSTPFEAWKAGFRECVKLSSGIIDGCIPTENEERLKSWLTTSFPGVPNEAYCLLGAKRGCYYGSNNADNPVALSRINDWKWLREQFNRGGSVE